MKKIFLSLPMKNRSDEAIKATIEGMKRILRAYYPNEELQFVDNFEAGYDIPQDMVDRTEHPQLLYISRALFKMADCTHLATIGSEVKYRGNERYRGCELEEMTADRYGLEIICINDHSGEVLLPDLYEKCEEEKKFETKVCIACDGIPV